MIILVLYLSSEVSIFSILYNVSSFATSIYQLKINFINNLFININRVSYEWYLILFLIFEIILHILSTILLPHYLLSLAALLHHMYLNISMMDLYLK